MVSVSAWSECWYHLGLKALWKTNILEGEDEQSLIVISASKRLSFLHICVNIPRQVTFVVDFVLSI